jgi:hypothetical protein
MNSCSICSDFSHFLETNSYKQLGNAIWMHLHSIATYYPSTPTLQEQHNMTHLIYNIAYFLPCKKCSKHFLEYIQHTPPNVISNTTLILWMCQFHNNVNQMLNKPEFDCNTLNVTFT